MIIKQIMMKSLSLLNLGITFSLILMLQSCASVSYISDSLGDFLPNNFLSYSTEEHCDESVNRLMALRIKNAIDLDLSKRGYKRSDDPDVLIQYFIKQESKTFIDDCNYYERWERGGRCRERAIEYEVGTIVVDFINTETNTIFWHGAITSPAFSSFKDPNKKVNNMIAKLLDEKYFGDTTYKDLAIEN